MSTSIGKALTTGANVLRDAGVAEARREAGSLLSAVIGKDRTFLISHAEDQLSEDSLVQFQEFVQRRANREPLQYIVGVQDFFGREFRVTPDVLIPRPETEILVEAALEIAGSGAPSICDVGTGSGCIAVTLLCEVEDARAIGLDKSAAALEIARLNAENLAVSNRIRFAVSDCFASLDPAQEQFDLVVSNPPYVAAAMIDGLQVEVRDHEPLMALSAGPDGLIVIRRLLVESPAFLKKGGHMIMEIGFDQGHVIPELINRDIWDLLEIRPDLQGIPRIVVLTKK